MNMLNGMWSDVNSLKFISAMLQWISIGLVFISGFLQLGKFVIERREKKLNAQEQSEMLNPTFQPIRTGTVTVDVFEESNETINTHFMDRGGYLAFCKGKETLMIFASIESFAQQTGHGEVNWRGIFNLDVTDQSVGKPIRFLLDSEYAQIGFVELKEKSTIRRGMAIVTINSIVRLEIKIPEQQMNDDKIIVDGVGKFLDPLR